MTNSSVQLESPARSLRPSLRTARSFEAGSDEEASSEPPVRVWSAEEVRQLQAGVQHQTPGRIVMWQLAVTAGVLLIGAALQASGAAAIHLPSLAWGALAACLPSALMAWGLRREVLVQRQAPMHSASLVLTRLFAWELVKIVTSVALLALAPSVVPGLSWLALIVAFVLVMKASFVVLLSGVRGQHRSLRTV